MYQADTENHDEEEGDDVVHVTVGDVGDQEQRDVVSKRHHSDPGY